MNEIICMILGVIAWECLKWYWRVDFFDLRGHRDF
jgi:hypothetical protein